MKVIGRNVETDIQGDILIIRINLSERFGKSKSEKSIQIASSGGNRKITTTKDGEPIKVGVNCYIPID